MSSIPDPKTNGGRVVSYTLRVENDKGMMHVQRKLGIDGVLILPKFYPALRNFFQVVRTGDEEQIVLQQETSSAAN